MLCVPLCELQSQLEQALLHRRIEGDLNAVHGARDEPHGQVIVVREGEEEEIKPGWIDLKCSLYEVILTFHSDTFVSGQDNRLFETLPRE